MVDVSRHLWVFRFPGAEPMGGGYTEELCDVEGVFCVCDYELFLLAVYGMVLAVHA